jgi:chromate transporter
MPILLELFLTFAKIGLFTFGGGYAMISVIDTICVDKKKWITHDEMMDVTVIAESTPGPISVNCATFVGFKQAGLLGGIMATLGVILPSFVIIYIISMFLANFLAIPLVAHAFVGIRAGVGLLILNAADTMLRKMQKKTQPRLFMLCGLVAMTTVNVLNLPISSIHILLVAAVVALAIFIAKGAPEMPAKGGAAK